MRVGVRLGLGAWGRTLLAGLPPSRSPRCLWRGPRRPWLLQPRSSPRLRLRGPPPLQALLRVSRLLRLRLSLPKLRPRCGAAAALSALAAALLQLSLPPLPGAARPASPPASWPPYSDFRATFSSLASPPVRARGRTARDRAPSPRGDREWCWGRGYPSRLSYSPAHPSRLSYSPAPLFPITFPKSSSTVVCA